MVVIFRVSTTRACRDDDARLQTARYDNIVAALNTLDETVLSQCRDRHINEVWITFLRQIDRSAPKGKQVHIIADNYAAHKTRNVRRWLGKHNRFQMHYTPPVLPGSRFFRDITQQRIQRGVFHSVAELTAAIGEYVQNHNRHPKPFIWTAKASDILQKSLALNRRSISPLPNDSLH